jgi:outer membrane murein-binding lipoprotein Lpp
MEKILVVAVLLLGSVLQGCASRAARTQCTGRLQPINSPLLLEPQASRAITK